jgi:hypothetical protein
MHQCVSSGGGRHLRSARCHPRRDSFRSAPDSRFSVASRKLALSSPKKRTNCFGSMARESGHRRVPDPPANTTGTMLPCAPSAVASHRSCHFRSGIEQANALVESGGHERPLCVTATATPSMSEKTSEPISAKEAVDVRGRRLPSGPLKHKPVRGTTSGAAPMASVRAS